MRPHGVAARKSLPDFIESGAVESLPQFAKQIVRERHSFQRRSRLELPVQVRRYIPDLNHDGHAISI